MFFEAMTFLVGIEKLHGTVRSVILCIYTSDFILPIFRCVIPFVFSNTIRREVEMSQNIKFWGTKNIPKIVHILKLQ